MISKTKIHNRMSKKTNPELAKTIYLAKKNGHLKLAQKLSRSTRQQIKINLEELNKVDENKLIVPGKILGEGNINKKINISALSFSKEASLKLKSAGCNTNIIKNELEQNPELKGIKIYYGKNNN